MGKYESSIEWGENYNMLKKSINTSVAIKGNNLEVKSEENERFTPEEKRSRHFRAKYSKPFNPFFLGEKTIDIEDILSIKVKNGRIFGIYTILVLFFLIIAFSYLIYHILNCSMDWMEIFVPLPGIIIVIYLFLFILLDFEEVYKFKSLKINIKNEKSVCIPIEGGTYQNKVTLQNFIDNMHKENSKIKVKNAITRNKIILITIFIAVIITANIYIIFNTKNNVANSDTYNVDVNVYEAKLIKKYKISNSLYTNTYFLEDENKKVKITESDMDSFKKEVNQKYYLWCFKYYSRANNKLLKTEYETKMFNSENNFIYTYKYNDNVQYWFNCIDHKIYKFYDPQYSKTSSFSNDFSYIVIPYNKNKEYNDDNFNKIYEFIHADESQSSQEDNDLIKIIETFDSKYGKCYIIKYKYLPCYYLYIENEDIRSKEDYDGIFLYKKNINYFNDIKAINYFKEVISEE